MNVTVRRLHFKFYDSVPSWVNGAERFGIIVRNYLHPRMIVLNLGARSGERMVSFRS